MFGSTISEASEVMFTILPLPCRRMTRAASWQAKNALFRFTVITRSQSASVKVSAGWRMLTPAPLTRMSRRP